MQQRSQDMSQFSSLATEQQSLKSSQQPIQAIMEQLEYFSNHNPRQLSQQIQNNPHYPLGHLKDYVTLYVQNHNRSEELFNLMCEHNMLAKLFSGVARPIYILEIFNLLLANTQEISELVYIFSHPLFHNYLLINVQPILNLSVLQGTNSNASQSTIMSGNQAVQYYVQLIKTLVMKLQSESNQCTLLKLFCNSKYAYYPLLTNCIVLAIRRNIKQQLVRVTAQHCILQLIEIMARKKVGQYYFSNIHMLIFFYEIISQTIDEQTTQSTSQDSTIKFIIDLLKAFSLSQNSQAKQKTCILFFSIFSNLVVFKFMKNPSPGLYLLLKLSNLLNQVQQLQQLPLKYLTPIYFIFAKLLFNKYLNNVSLSSIILISEDISELSTMKDVNILKIIKTHHEKITVNSEQIEVSRNSLEEKQKRTHIFFSRNSSSLKDTKSLVQKDYQPQLKQIQKYNMDNSQFLSLKQNFYKKSTNNSGNFFTQINFLFKKINMFDLSTNDYIKKLCRIAAVRYTPQQPLRFLDDVFAPTAVYLYELLKIKSKEKYIFGQKTQDTEKIEISFNENRDEFLIDSHFFKLMLNLAQIALSQIDSFSEDDFRKSTIVFLQQKFNHKLAHPGQVYFILHFRQYFQNSIFQFVCSSSSNVKSRSELTSKILMYIYKIASSLEMDLNESNKNKIKTEILKLEKDLYSIVKQKGFQAFRQYLESGKQKKIFEEPSNSLSKQTSMIKFDTKQSLKNSDKKSSTKQKKKKSIFKSFRSQIQSPSKDIDNFSMIESQTLKIVESKMIHLQLLRFILQKSESKSSSFERFKQIFPLQKIFEAKFLKKYSQYLKKGHETIFQAFELSFNTQQNNECILKVKANFDDYAIFCELYHNTKLILKTNIKDFNLSEPIFQGQEKIEENGKSMTMSWPNIQVRKKTDPRFLLTILPTLNTLGFNSKDGAFEFLNKMNQLKFGFKQIKDASILQYLNKGDQIPTFF